MFRVIRLSLFFVVMATSFLLPAQPSMPGENIVAGGPRLKVDCHTCDFDYLKRSLDFVNFVRDVQSADIYIKLTSQSTGGGEKHNIYFEGQNMYVGITDTLVLMTESDDTFREKNTQILQSFKTGLLAFMMVSPLKDQISWDVKRNTNNHPVIDKSEQTDPWNFWVFSVSGNASFSAESNYNNLRLRGGIHASRKTEASKWNLSYNSRYSESNFYFRDEDNTLIDSLSIHSYQQNQSLWTGYVHSLTDKWSLAVNGNVWENSFSNYNTSGRVEGGVEYNFYPYDESDRHMFVLTYQIGGQYNDYVDTTIYNKTEEWLASQSLEAFLSQNQKWGYLSIDASFTNYLHDMNLNRLSIRPNVNWNVFKGLTLEIGSRLSYMSNQLNLPKGDADISDILLRDRLLATNFDVSGHMSIRYSFGSQYANAVNPRFWGRG